MRRSYPHSRAILERTETLPADHLMKIHCAVRAMRAVPLEESAGTAEDAEIDGVMESWDPFADRPPVDCVRIFTASPRWWGISLPKTTRCAWRAPARR
jgi:hypothetical protein